MFQAINKYMCVEYTIPDKLIDMVLPITRNERTNISEEDVQIFPSFSLTMKFKESVNKTDFMTFVLARLSMLDSTREAVVLSSDTEIPVGTTVYVKGHLPGQNKFIGRSEADDSSKHKSEDIKKGKIKSYITMQNIMAYKIEDTFKPLTGYVEIKIPLDESIKQLQFRTGKTLQNYIDDEELRTQDNFSHMFLSQLSSQYNVRNTIAEVSQVSDTETQVKEGDVVSFNVVGFQFSNSTRIDLTNEVAYFLLPTSFIFGKK